VLTAIFKTGLGFYLKKSKRISGNFAANIRNFMKSRIKKILQKLLGFDRYLFIFSVSIISTLRWNRNERDFIYFLKLIPDGGTVLDIGANIGIMSVWLGRKLKQSQILAFEPIPQNIKALKKVLRYYGLQNVKVVEKAVGNNNGKAEMVMPILDEVKMQGLSHIVHESINEFNDGKIYQTSIVKLDDCLELKQDDLQLTAIKLDVENFEYFALAGAKNLISKHKPLIYTELWENENRNKCFELLQPMGYQVKVIQNKQLVAYDHKRHHTQNFFFVP
jgi:FkbM family methyltransferase